MKKLALTTVIVIGLVLMGFKPVGKLVSKNTFISFYSHTSIEDITANNYKVVSTLDTDSGALVFSVPMQGFEFEKALMQKHFNGKDFLNTKEYPKSKFVGKIDNIGDVNFGADGSYDVNVSGSLTIKDKENAMNEKATITVSGGKVTLDAKMKVVLADYNVTFTKGKPSNNIAKEVEVTVKGAYGG